MSKLSLEERVARIEKIFWVVGVVAIIFGLSGAWGISLLRAAQAEISTLQNDLASVRTSATEAARLVTDSKSQIEKETKHQLENVKPAVQDLAEREVKTLFRNRAAFAATGTHISSLGRHTTIKLRVKKGDLIHASYTASAKNSEFYFRIVDVNSLAVPLTKSTQLVQNANQPWRPIATQEIFRADNDRELQLAVEFFKGDIGGNVTVYNSTLIALIVGADG